MHEASQYYQQIMILQCTEGDDHLFVLSQRGVEWLCTHLNWKSNMRSDVRRNATKTSSWGAVL